MAPPPVGLEEFLASGGSSKGKTGGVRRSAVRDFMRCLKENDEDGAEQALTSFVYATEDDGDDDTETGD